MLVAAACVVADALPFVIHGPPASSATWWLVLVAVIGADLLLAAPTRWVGPTALVAVAVHVAGALVLPCPQAPVLNEAGLLVAVFRVGAWLEGWRPIVILVVVVVGIVAAHLARGVPLDVGVMLLAGRLGIIPWLVGRYTAARREHADELRRMNEQRGREQEALVQEAVDRERSSIARDLHDVITHHVSAVGVHSGAARLQLQGGDEPEAVLRSIAAVEHSSRSAMQDLREMLDVLHGATPGPGPRGVDGIAELVRDLRTTGLAIDLQTTGDVTSLTSTVGDVLFQVAREMMTNVLRHGDGTGATLRIAVGDDGVRMTCTNATRERAAPSAGGGRGLAGVQARLEPVDGTLTAGLDRDGRWTTEARVPAGAS